MNSYYSLKPSVFHIAFALILCTFVRAQTTQPTTLPAGQWTQLFNGKDLTGFYSWSNALGRNNDPEGYFKVENGMIHVLNLPVSNDKKDPAYFATENYYANFHLRFQYKFGEKRFAPRNKPTSKRDAGCLYFLIGDDHVWPRSLECQVEEGDTGDAWIAGNNTNVSLDATVQSLDPKEKVFSPSGVSFTLTKGRIIKDPQMDSLTDWNTVEVYAKGNSAVHVVNGTIVNSVSNVMLTDTHQPMNMGRIAFQAEYAEVYYRNIEIMPLADDEKLPQPKTWKVNDRTRPRPTTAETKPEAELIESSKPPANAIVLFDGKDLSSWQPSTQPVSWNVQDGYAEIVKKAGNLLSKDSYGSCKLHVEWRAPSPPLGKDQAQGNSGVYMMSNYEMQVLDNTNNPTYPDGMAGAVYGENPPLFDACRPSGEWNYYDIEFHRPIFDAAGQVTKQAKVTIYLNGVKVQDNFELTGPTAHNIKLPYVAHADKMPLYLQNHGQIVRYRNIWIVPLDDDK